MFKMCIPSHYNVLDCIILLHTNRKLITESHLYAILSLILSSVTKKHYKINCKQPLIFFSCACAAIHLEQNKDVTCMQLSEFLIKQTIISRSFLLETCKL